MKSKLIRLVTVLWMAALIGTATSAAYSVPSASHTGEELTSHRQSRGDYQQQHPYGFCCEGPRGYLEYRHYYPGFFSGYHYRTQSFPYQCGPFLDSRRHGHGGYSAHDERCVYPYHRSYDHSGRYSRLFRDRLNQDITITWIGPSAARLVWNGNPNGVTAVEFNLIDYSGVGRNRVMLAHPPYTATVYVPDGTQSIRVRTYGLLGSILFETTSPLP